MTKTNEQEFLIEMFKRTTKMYKEWLDNINGKINKLEKRKANIQERLDDIATLREALKTKEANSMNGYMFGIET